MRILLGSRLLEDGLEHQLGAEALRQRLRMGERTPSTTVEPSNGTSMRLRIGVPFSDFPP